MDVNPDVLFDLSLNAMLAPAGVAVLAWFFTEFIVKKIPAVESRKDAPNSGYGLIVNASTLVIALLVSVLSSGVLNGWAGADVGNSLVVGIAGTALSVLGYEVGANIKKKLASG